MVKKRLILIILVLVVAVSALLLVGCNLFRQGRRTLSVIVEEGGSISGEGDYTIGSYVIITATPNKGYSFDGWYEENQKISPNHSYTFNMPSKNLTLEARFSFKYNSGLGTKESPLIITNKEQLLYFAESVNYGTNYSYDTYFAMGADINLDGMDWTPIGIYYYAGGLPHGQLAFQGNFDGRNFKIYNFIITGKSDRSFPEQSDFGFFGAICNAEIKNLGVADFTMNVETSECDNIGGLIGFIYSSAVSNCNAIGDISVPTLDSARSINVGGLIGYIDYGGTISNCYSMVSVCSNSSIYVGGLLGYARASNISNCYATGDVSSSNCAGGLIGELEGYSDTTTVINCYATGNVSVFGSTYTCAGGLIGTTRLSVISGCYATGDVSINSGKNAYAGGLIGHAYGSGVAGQYDPITISNCYATGNISGSTSDYNAYIGGLIGYIEYSLSTISNCYATGEVIASVFGSANAYGGGLVGHISSLSVFISCCYATGNVFASNSYGNTYIGGLVGFQWSTPISNCYATGNISAVGSSGNYDITYAGGLVGRCSDASISNSYATGNVSASGSSDTYLGGLVGVGIYSVADFNCHRYVGQIFYRKVGSIEYDTPRNSIGTACTKEQLDSENFYIVSLGWSIKIWDFSELDFENGIYPKLL